MLVNPSPRYQRIIFNKHNKLVTGTFLLKAVRRLLHDDITFNPNWSHRSRCASGLLSSYARSVQTLEVTTRPKRPSAAKSAFNGIHSLVITSLHTRNPPLPLAMPTIIYNLILVVIRRPLGRVGRSEPEEGEHLFQTTKIWL